MITLISSLYFLSLIGLATFGLLGLVTLYFYWRHRQDKFPLPPFSEKQLPHVTIQLPLYNERFVLKRLLKAVVDLEYPRDRLHIQVLDDSTDQTTRMAVELVRHYQDLSFDIELLHRTDRTGFKAGALEAGLHASSAELIAIFDADFRPDSKFLLQTVPYFLTKPTLGMVQTRWGHINPFDSQLTAAQTIALDKHFAMEQTVRHRANLYPKFNGSGGIWRRQCLLDAGGWVDDTVCEDLCMSTRAVLKGWEFIFLNDIVSPAELPATISAYKNQQARWAKGSTQCLIKYARAILTDSNHSVLARSYALLSMAGYLTHFWLIILLLVQIPLVALGYQPPIFVVIFGLAGIAQPILFVLGQQTLYLDWWRRMKFVPALLLVAIGLAPSNTRSIIEVILGQPGTFVRTPKNMPKHNNSTKNMHLRKDNYHPSLDWIVLIEYFLAGYALFGLVLCILLGNFGPILFLLSCTLGYGFVAIVTTREQLFLSGFTRRSLESQPSET